MPTKKTAAQLDREIGELLSGSRQIAHVGFGTFPSSRFKNPAWEQHLAERQYHPTRAHRRDPKLPKGETFTCTDRNGKILGTSKTIAGAMEKAPAGSSYARVRGEYTSDGHHWGLGRGRQVAVREGSKRWQVG